MNTTTELVQAPVLAPPTRPWHICAGEHTECACRPGCVAYCGHVYRPGPRKPQTRDGVPDIDICVICQGLREAVL